MKNEQIIYDGIYDDGYRHPIQNLLERYKPDTIKSLVHVLENNGYLGRFTHGHKLYEIARGRTGSEILLWIRTTHSGQRYRFYPRFEHELGHGVLRPRAAVKGFRKDEKMIHAMEIFITEYCALPFTLHQKTGWEIEICNKIIDDLYNIKMIQDDQLIFSDARDVQEIYNNIIKQIV